MKIQEQEWTTQSNGLVAVSDAVVIKVEVAPWRLSRVPGADDWKVAAEVSQQVTTAIESVPEMVRALLAVRDAFPPPASEEEMNALEAVVDALRSAGIL